MIISIMETIDETETTKKIIIIEEPKSKSTTTNTNKKVKTEKEKKKRVETSTWSITDEQLVYDNQLQILNRLYDDLHNINNNINNINNNDSITTTTTTTTKDKPDKYYKTVVSHLKSKISGYKHQDVTKNMFNETQFTTLSDVVTLLYDSKSQCCYCHSNVYILYELVRENKQWSLDRIDNNLGHNIGNLVIACLECNLKRRRTNKDSFMFTKNMKLVKLQD
jgi:hypothetical protein